MNSELAIGCLVRRIDGESEIGTVLMVDQEYALVDFGGDDDGRISQAIIPAFNLQRLEVSDAD